MYFVVYDYNDKLIAYIDDIKELATFTGLRTFDVVYKFKHTTTNFILFKDKDSDSFKKIYKFVE